MVTPKKQAHWIYKGYFAYARKPAHIPPLTKDKKKSEAPVAISINRVIKEAKNQIKDIYIIENPEILGMNEDKNYVKLLCVYYNFFTFDNY